MELSASFFAVSPFDTYTVSTNRYQGTVDGC